MNPLPKPISQFLKEKHIVSFTAHYQEDFWLANCFYAFDEQKVRLIVMTRTTTRHAQLMLKNSHIVGTIAGQPNKIKDMEGIQFTALAHLLENQEERKKAFDIYIKKLPFYLVYQLERQSFFAYRGVYSENICPIISPAI